MRRPPHLLALLVATQLAACASDDPLGEEDACRDDDKCDLLDRPDAEVAATPCDGLLVDRSGRGHDKVAGRLRDPLALKVFRAGADCPTTFADIMARLRATDTAGCPTDDPRAGIATRLVTETAQAIGAPTSYRLITSRACGERDSHALMFSLHGVAADASALPEAAEFVALDASTGVFNFYETDGKTIGFFGNSKDLLGGPAGEIRRCASCHVGGGLVMKELDTPWLHWEGHLDTPGTDELVARFADLGSEASGAELELVVKDANRAWNQRRLAFVRSKGTPKDLLRPLFCTQEINLDNGSDLASPVAGGFGGDELRDVTFDSLLDPRLAGFGAIPIDFADYDELIKANQQTVAGVPGAIDTVFDYVFVERSHIDNDYVDALIAAGVLDEELAQDVLLVDLTRPVFSDDRCGLLEFVPNLANATLDPASLKQGLLANLGAAAPAAGTPAAELLANLESTGGHDPIADAFTRACRKLPRRDFLAGALAITSLNRDLARARPILELPSSMPDDALEVAPGTRLDPKTCQLRTDFTTAR